MSKNVNVNGVDYSGVSQVQLKTTAGGTALFKDVDEITTPSGSVTITENGTHDVTNYAQAVVNVASGGSDADDVLASYKAVVEGTGGDITLPGGITQITNGVLQKGNLTGVTIPDSVTKFCSACFKNCTNLSKINIPKNLVTVENDVFYFCSNLPRDIVFPATVDYVGQFAFYNSGARTVTFTGTPSGIHTGAFSGNITVNAPWAEGEVEGAPWGAGNVNYNYTGA